MDKRISVIIPCYNVEQYIDRCVNSLVSQTIGVDSLELIFVDDASTDATVERLARWEAEYPESIVVVVCEENGRQGRARNIGFEYANAPWISFVDADDWVDREMLQDMYSYATQEEVEVVACDMGRDCGDGKLFDLAKICHNRTGLLQIETVQDRHDFLAVKLGPVIAKLYRKSFLLEHDLVFPEGVAYEDNYFCGIMQYCIRSIYVTDKVYYHYFTNLHSTVTTRNSMHHLDRLEMEIMLHEELCRRGYYEEFYQEIQERFLRVYYLNSLHLIFMRFDELPYELLQTMRCEVLKRFPHYKESTVYERLSEISKGFCLTLETEMTPQMWDNLANNYRYLVKNKGQ